MRIIERGEALSLYRGRRVLITGGLGFIGLNLAAALREAQADTRILSRSWPPVTGGTRRILGRATFVKGDIRDAAVVQGAVDGCDIIFHMAGKSGPSASNASPLEDLDVNARGMLTLIEASRRTSPMPKIVFPSSRLVYTPNLPLPVAESSPTAPLSVYGIHKLAGERYLLLYQRLYGLRSTILRISNPYGPFQRPEQKSYGIVNWFIHQAINDETLSIYGGGTQQRDYIHVDDVVRAMLIVGVSPESDGQIFNVGSGEGVSFLEMAQLVVKSVGKGKLVYTEWPRDASLVETGDFVPNTTMIQHCLGWKASVPLASGIRDVVSRYRKLGLSWR